MHARPTRCRTGRARPTRLLLHCCGILCRPTYSCFAFWDLSRHVGIGKCGVALVDFSFSGLFLSIPSSRCPYFVYLVWCVCLKSMLYVTLACIVKQKTRLFENNIFYWHIYDYIHVSLTSTYICMHHRIVKSIITTETTYNFTHIDASTTKNTEINTIMSTKLANYTL